MHPEPATFSFNSSSLAPPPLNMSPATKEMIARVRQMIPPMLERFHKGRDAPENVAGRAAADHARVTQDNWGELVSLAGAKTTPARHIFRPWQAQGSGVIWLVSPFL